MSLYLGISIIALLVIVALLFLVRGKERQYSKPSNPAVIGISFVVLGIVFGDERVLGYSLMGVGVLISVVDVIRNRKTK